MYRIAKRLFLVLIPLAALIALACGDLSNQREAVTVPCGDCAAGTVHKNAWLSNPEDLLDAVACFDSWHDDEAPDCVVLIEYDDIDECPFETEPGVETLVEYYTDQESVEHAKWSCPLPRLEAPLDCDDAAAAYPEETTELGWYYCQDNNENYDQACDGMGPFAGIDEDGDGHADCDDEECAVCAACGGDGVGCAISCKYAFKITEPARAAVLGRPFDLHCAACTQEEPAGVDCGIDSQVVGQQCTPSDFTQPDDALISGTTYALELSDQCGGGPCLTSLHPEMFANPVTVLLHDHCTCRCGDLEGNDHTSNPDLCKCPGNSLCEPVCDFGAVCPESLQGSFCMPACVSNPCIPPEECTPPASGDPWKWTCEG